MSVHNIEIKVIKRGKSGWKEDPISYNSGEWQDFIKRHSKEKGSFQAVIKVNEGYAKNKETGTTAVIDWKGEFLIINNILDDIIKAYKSKYTNSTGDQT